jgi:RNA-directed DNA polymerase
VRRHGSGPTVPQVDDDRQRALLHNCATMGPSSQNRDNRPDFHAHLLGRIAWVGSLDPTRGPRLREQFDAIDW